MDTHSPTTPSSNGTTAMSAVRHLDPQDTLRRMMARQKDWSDLQLDDEGRLVNHQTGSRATSRATSRAASPTFEQEIGREKRRLQAAAARTDGHLDGSGDGFGGNNKGKGKAIDPILLSQLLHRHSASAASPSVDHEDLTITSSARTGAGAISVHFLPYDQVPTSSHAAKSQDRHRSLPSSIHGTPKSRTEMLPPQGAHIPAAPFTLQHPSLLARRQRTSIKSRSRGGSPAGSAPSSPGHPGPRQNHHFSTASTPFALAFTPLPSLTADDSSAATSTSASACPSGLQTPTSEDHDEPMMATISRLSMTAIGGSAATAPLISPAAASGLGIITPLRLGDTSAWPAVLDKGHHWPLGTTPDQDMDLGRLDEAFGQYAVAAPFHPIGGVPAGPPGARQPAFQPEDKVSNGRRGMDVDAASPHARATGDASNLTPSIFPQDASESHRENVLPTCPSTLTGHASGYQTAAASGSGNGSASSNASRNNAQPSVTTHGQHSRPPAARGFSGGSGSGNGDNDDDDHHRDNDGRKEDKSSSRASKKKAHKACLHCQKAHLTCDDLRPCTRCVKKGIGDTCVEGQRKKAKYLMNEEEKAAQSDSPSSKVKPKRTASNSSKPRKDSTSGDPVVASPMPMLSGQGIAMAPNFTLDPPPIGAAPAVATMSNRSLGAGMPSNSDALHLPAEGESNGGVWGQDSLHESDPIFNLSFDPSFPFDSKAANLEYTMLSSIFNDASSANAVGGPMPLQPGAGDPPLFQLDSSWPDASNGTFGGSSDLLTSPPFGTSFGAGPPLNPRGDFPDSNGSSGGASTLGLGPDGKLIKQTNGITLPYATTHAFGNLGTNGMEATPSASSTSIDGAPVNPATVYQQVTKPHDYTEGYHFLMRYLAKNFEQADALKVVKSLAAFRPSLIALQMPLSTEDEVFLEKSFQRTLIELEKLISYSGTPTAVWRRTGEICLAGDEFCKVAKRKRKELLNEKSFIYELFDKASTVEYFEKFSQHAFENTTQNFFMRCKLVGDGTADGGVPCSCSFTIRRDVFDLPSVIIGQFLPSSPAS